MIIKSEIDLEDFNFWGGALDRTKYLTHEDFQTLEQMFIDLYPDGLEEVLVNDTFWFDEDFIADCLGYDSFEGLMEDRKDERV